MPRGIYNRKTSAARVRSTAQDIARHVPTVETPEEDAPVILSAKVTRAVDAIRLSFRAFVDDFAQLTQSREELAPRFMKTFNQWAAEAGGTFVDFVRVLVPDVPTDRDGYRAHPAYQAADYLRRLVAQQSREGATPTARAEAVRNRPVNPRHALARVVASIVPLISPDALDSIFAAMQTQLHWTENQVAGIRDLVSEETPLFRIRAPRGVHLEQQLKIGPAPVVSEDAAATA